MQLSVIIVNYNVCDLLLSALESLYVAMEGIEGEVIVVDNASSDGAVEAINRLYPSVITVALERNIGFGAANNIGIEMARGEYTLILNPDTILQEETIRTMLAFMEEHPEATFAGCRIILPDGSLDPVSKRGFPSPWSSFCRVFGLSRLFPRSRFFGGYNLTYMEEDRVAEIDALAGCFMFCRTRDLKELEGFDTDFFMYGEDLDLCYRAKKRGGRIFYLPDTSIMHRKGESTRRSSIDALAHFYEAMEIFARKHFRANPPMLLLVRIGILLRRGIARIGERFPGLAMAPIDLLAALAGFILGSILKFGTPFYYPDWAVPVVWTLPPLLFVGSLALVRAYELDERVPVRSLLGALLGFFVLSTLTYFFKDYAFSRGVLLVTTAVVAASAVTSRFVRLVWRRAFGAEAIRRVAILSRQPVDGEARRAVGRLFFGRPVIVVGTIAPTFSELPSEDRLALGSVDNIAQVVRRHDLSDVVVFDTRLSYSEVLRAMELTGTRRVRFHVLHESTGGATLPLPERVERGWSPPRHRRRGTVRDRAVALAIHLFGWPLVYWLLPDPGGFLRGTRQVILGRRPLVGSGVGGREGERPLFDLATIVGTGGMEPGELEQIDEFYRGNMSLLLDVEIIIATLRRGRSAAAAGPRPQSSDRLEGTIPRGG